MIDKDDIWWRPEEVEASSGTLSRFRSYSLNASSALVKRLSSFVKTRSHDYETLEMCYDMTVIDRKRATQADRSSLTMCVCVCA